MNRMNLILLIFLIFKLFNCVTYTEQNLVPIPHQPVGPTHGLLFTANSFPGEFNSNNDVKREVMAEGCLYQLLFIVVWGDASAGSIAFENSISRIASIDHRTESVLGLFASYCTIIVGEK